MPGPRQGQDGFHGVAGGGRPAQDERGQGNLELVPERGGRHHG